MLWQYKAWNGRAILHWCCVGTLGLYHIHSANFPHGGAGLYIYVCSSVSLSVRPGLLLTQVWLPSVAVEFSLRVIFTADSSTVFTQPPSAVACTEIRTCIKNPEHCQLRHCLDTQKYCTLGQPSKTEWDGDIKKQLQMQFISCKMGAHHPNK